MQIDFNEQYAKHDSSILRNLDSLGNTIFSILVGRFLSPENTEFPAISRQLGTEIDFNRLLLKQNCSIRISFESVSNVKSSMSAPANANSLKVVTERGTQIDLMDE
jgi:hypothetical protein